MDNSIVVCGAGFLGSWFCRFYAQRANALSLKNKVYIIDDGVFEERNIPTQQMAFRHLGVSKARVAETFIEDYQIEARAEIARLNIDDIGALAGLGCVLVVDMFDNYPSRILTKMMAQNLGCECLHVSISHEGFGKVEWSGDWSLDPTRVMIWPTIAEVETPPCELVVYQELGVKIAMRGAVEATQYLLGLTTTSWLVADNQNTPLR